MSDIPQDLARRTVVLRQRDHRASEVVPSAATETQHLEVVLQALVGVVLRSHLSGRGSTAVGHGKENVGRQRVAIHQCRPTLAPPPIQNRRKRRMNGHVPPSRRLRMELVIGPTNHEPPERRAILVIVHPLQSCSLSVAKTSNAEKCVEDSPIRWNATVRDEALELLATEDRAVPPVWIGIDSFPE